MPDWKEILQREMAALNLPPEKKQEVISELASHFEDGECEGSSEIREMTDARWRNLSRAIEHSKSEDGIMNHRAKGLWLPAFLNLLLTSALINVCGWLGWVDMRITQPSHTGFAIQPWVLTLPFCGALTAYLARRGQGSSVMRMIAALSPCFAWLATIPILKVILMCFPGIFAGMPLRALALAAVGWFVVPALALSLGAIPFLRESKPIAVQQD